MAKYHVFHQIERKLILAFAECNMNESEVARKMHYHRGSVWYHLSKIQKKTGLDPKNFYDLIKLVEIAKEGDDG